MASTGSYKLPTFVQFSRTHPTVSATGRAHPPDNFFSSPTWGAGSRILVRGGVPQVPESAYLVSMLFACRLLHCSWNLGGCSPTRSRHTEELGTTQLTNHPASQQQQQHSILPVTLQIHASGTFSFFLLLVSLLIFLLQLWFLWVLWQPMRFTPRSMGRT